MLSLAHPAWLGLLLPLLVLAGLQWRRGRVSQEAVSVALVHPQLDWLARSQVAQPSGQFARWLNLLSLICLVLALAQPQWIGGWLPETPQGREIMLLVDTSKSMGITDFELDGQPVERLVVLKDLVTRFVTGRQGDRFGVIAFGSVAGTLVPPTFDLDLVRAMLARLQVGIGGDDTAIGDAIGLALKQLRARPRLRPALILFTDGDSTAGDITPGEAIELARHFGVPIYTVQIGGDLFAAGRPSAPAHTPASAPGLAQIAAATGGRYYQAGNRGALQSVIHDIGQREKTVARPATRRVVQEWYLLPLLLAVGLLSLARLSAIRRVAA
ncbi:MAG TPA: VWA domain-containing protein [Sulfuriferula sp.]|nr:VWA domain-containing protein [Sulfuriferula sp.]